MILTLTASAYTKNGPGATDIAAGGLADR
jgi:hypothetical protein